MNFLGLVQRLAEPSATWLFGILAEASLKGSVLLLLAWGVTRLLRAAPASLRHLVWSSALGGTLMLPLLSAAVPRLGIALLPRVESPAVPAPASPVFSSPPVAASSAEAPTEALPFLPLHLETLEPLTSNGITWPPSFTVTDAARLAPLLWVVIAALLLARIVLGNTRLSAWTRRAFSVDDGAWLALTQRAASRLGITRPVTLLRSERACVPMTWGVVYPIVLLPIDADEWSDERRTIVLMHEMAHVKRFDAFTQVLGQIGTALFWFNPLVWLAVRQMRIEREYACDDLVLAAGARPTDYAHDLLQIARALGGSSAPAAAALAMARHSEFEGRLLAILDPTARRYGVSKVRVAIVGVLALILAVPLAALAPEAAAAVPPANELPTPVASPAIALPSDIIAEPRVPLPPAVPSLPALPALPVVPVPAISPPAVVAQSVLDRVGPVVAAAVPALARAPRSSPDIETLIAVSRAAGKLTSDNDKAELLLTVAKHYVPDNELRLAYLGAVSSIRSSNDQTRALLPILLKDDFPPGSVEPVVKTMSRISSDNAKASLLAKVATSRDSLTSSVRDVLIAGVTTINSDGDRGRAIAAIVQRGGLSNAQVVDLLVVTKRISSSSTKADVLLRLASRVDLSDKPVRDAFVQSAETISSAHDYRRVITSLLR